MFTKYALRVTRSQDKVIQYSLPFPGYCRIRVEIVFDRMYRARSNALPTTDALRRVQVEIRFNLHFAGFLTYSAFANHIVEDGMTIAVKLRTSGCLFPLRKHA